MFKFNFKKYFNKIKIKLFIYYIISFEFLKKYYNYFLIYYYNNEISTHNKF